MLSSMKTFLSSKSFKESPHGLSVMVNGCFDLFHDGHKHLLQYAAKLAHDGFLLVLVNTDESVQELKGPTRPVEEISERLEKVDKYLEDILLRETGDYNWITVEFGSEEELREYIDVFEPDLIVKGNDRPDVREVVGSDKWPVVILPRLEQDGGPVSTTRILHEQEV